MMSHREFEHLVGDKVPATVEMMKLGEDLWHRLEDGRWERYAPSPAR
jgi:hypothetical protein